MNDETRTLHMIGNAHIDPVWLWNWQEGFHEVIASFRSALDRLAEDDDFVFVSSSAVFYAWVERVDPDMFEEIRRRVREGRWEIVGGWWLQPDCNVPGGEGFVRQALYGQRYFQEKFGVTARVGYNVDSFGHHGMLPQLLAKSGLTAYVFLRPGPHELGLPGRLFWWESDDGSRVLGFRIPFEYCTWGKDLELHVRRCAGELTDPVDELMCFYGVGNHGGGPTVENLASIRRLDAEPDLPKLTFSSPNRYFDAVRERDWTLPVVHHDLQHHASGTYAAHSGVKRWNRRAERLLTTAETFATIAARVVGQPLHEDLRHAWHGVLFNQFHDILAGTSLESAYEDARDLYGEATSIGSRALNDALQAIAWKIDVPHEEGVRPLVVFNPHAWDARMPVEIESGRIREGEVLLDDEGEEVALQTVQSEATANGRERLLFVAHLPALGYRTYRIAPRESTRTFEPVQANDGVLENDRYRLELDPDTGTIVGLRDKEAGTEVFAGPAAVPVVLDDPSDTWSHNVFRFDREAGRFEAESVRLVEHGPVRSTLRVTSRFGASTLVQDFRLYRELDAIHVSAEVDWQETHQALKLRFPVHVHLMRATSEIPYGHVERFANGEEEPGQRWVDVSGSSRETGALYGFALLNDGKSSYDVNVRDIGLTVLRSPVYAHHVPAQPRPDERYSVIDRGVQRFTYALLPHTGGWAEAGTFRRAAELDAPPPALFTTFHEGRLPQRASYLDVDRPNVDVTVLKPAEDGGEGETHEGAVVVRAFETSGNRTTARIRLHAWDRTIDATFGPCEIKTFRIPADPSDPVVETNLIEWTA